MSLVPSAAENSPAYKTLVGKVGKASLDSYSCQVYDQVVLTALALARAAEPSPNGTTVRDNVRAISQDEKAEKITDVSEGLKLISAKMPIDYDGASGPLTFAANGDVEGVFFRYEQVEKGKMALLKVA